MEINSDLEATNKRLADQIDHIILLSRRIDQVRNELTERIDQVRNEITGKTDRVRTELAEKIDHLRNE